jgi:VTC domain
MATVAAASERTPPVIGVAFEDDMTFFDSIAGRLSLFDAHSLADISKSALMERIDTKFLVPSHMVEGLLDEIRDHFSVLMVEGQRISRYGTHYYDSHDLRFYHAHHNGALNRYKVRCRTYVNQRCSYLEVKLKNNKGRTVKRRVAVHAPGLPLLSEQLGFLESCGVSRIEDLVETQECNYQRAAFYCKSTGERFSLDFNLSYADNAGRSRASIGDVVVVELKQNYLNRDSSLSKALRRRNVRACGFSKYCIGLRLLRGQALKANRFKEALLRIERINRNSRGVQVDA